MNKFLKYKTLIALAFTIVMCIVFQIFFTGGFIPSESMENTLRVQDLTIGQRVWKNTTINRLDIITFDDPEEKGEIMIKRVIGLPGDTVTIKDSNVYVNGKKLNEPYIKEKMEKEKTQTYHVPKNHYFCLGDNRNDSYDSRRWINPYLHRKSIISKANIVLFPLRHFKIL